MSKEELDGVWRTIRGRRIFIKKGESLGEAMSRSGKFSRVEKNEAKREARFDDRANKVLKEKPFSRKQVKEQQKYSSKYNVRDVNSYNKDDKNRINENAKVNENAKTRVERNKEKYSYRDKQELKHEEVQNKLADYKAKKQSNNRIVENTKTGERYKELGNGQWRSEKDGYDYYLDMNSKNKDNPQYKEVKQSNDKVEENIESLSKLSRSELNEYDRGHKYKDSDVAEYVRNKTLYQESGLQRHYDAMKEAEKRYKQKKIDKENAKHPQYKGTDYEVKYASVDDAINDPNSAINKYIKEKEKIKSFKAKKQSNTLTRRQMAEALVDDQIKRGVIKQESREKQIQARLTGKFKMSYMELRDYYNEVLKKGK